MNRIGKCERKTKETDIEVQINLDGTGVTDIDTGNLVGFFPGIVQRRKQHRRQNGDDGDHDQKFDERKETGVE